MYTYAAIRMCGVAHVYVWHKIWRLPWDFMKSWDLMKSWTFGTERFVTTYVCIHVWRDSMTHSHEWHDLSSRTTHTYVRYDSFTCDMTHSYVWHDSFICVTWRIHTCDMSHSYQGFWRCMTRWFSHMWYDWLIMYMTQWLIHTWHDCMTHSYVTWHINVHDSILIHTWLDLLMFDTQIVEWHRDCCACCSVL